MTPSPARYPVIYLEPAAPPKPAVGAACNGCGVCCAVAPCPLGVIVSGRRTGACTALRWDADAARYLCAMVADPGAVWPQMPALVRAPLQALARRWIASGAGCDSDLDAAPGPG